MSLSPRILRVLPPDERKALDEQLKDQTLSYRSISQWLADRGHALAPEHVRRYAVRAKLRTPLPTSRCKIDKLLSPEHRVEYEAFVADARNTVVQAIQWLRARGYQVAENAVGLHRRNVNRMLDRMRESSRLAANLVQIAGELGAVGLSGGVLAQCEQALLQQFMILCEKKMLDPKTMSELCRSMNGIVASRDTLDTIQRREQAERRRAAAEGEAAAKRGASGKDVVARMREILGV